MVQACAAVDRGPERTRLVSGVGTLALLLGLLLLLSMGRTPYWPAGPLGVEDAEPLVLSLGPDGRELRFHGDFDDGAAERVRVLLDAHPGIARIRLTSDGGLVDEARAIAAMVAARGLATYVPDVCVSACTLAFVAGRERTLAAEAKLGFHAPFETDEAGREVQVDSAEERQDYLVAGLAPDFIDAALGTPSVQVWYPEVDRLRAAGVITAVVEAGPFPGSPLDGGATPALAREATWRGGR